MAGTVGRGLVAEGVGRGGRRHWVPSAGILGSPAGALGVAGGPGSPRGHAEAPGYQWLSDSGATPRYLRVSHACPPCTRPGRRRGAAACVMRVESCRAQRILNLPWSSGGPQWGRGTRARVHRGKGSCPRHCRRWEGAWTEPCLSGCNVEPVGRGRVFASWFLEGWLERKDCWASGRERLESESEWRPGLMLPEFGCHGP